MSINLSITSVESLRENGKNISVLYAEDDPLIRQEYTHFLKRFFPNVQSVSDGAEGLELCREKTFDLIISDIEMPRLNGMEMIEEIKQFNPNQASILVSAHNDSARLHHSIEIGVDGYLFKPIDRNQAIDTLNKIVRTLQIEKENQIYKHHLEEMIEAKNKEITELYTIDRITGLYTIGKLEQDIMQTSKSSLAFIKIIDFKNLNDFYGYEVGNSILYRTAEFLRDTADMLPSASLYRISGAHFAVLAPIDINDMERFSRLMITMFESMEISVDTEKMFLEMAIGIVDGHGSASLSHADIALRESTKNGSVVIYNNDETQRRLRADKLHLKDEIRRAINESRIEPFYQPIIDNVSQTIIKYEALARLILQDGTVLSPALFLSVAKETKMYSEVSEMIISKALNDFKDSECHISLNLSVDDIKSHSTRSFIFSQIESFPEPHRIVFEILETDGFDSCEGFAYFLNRLKQYGCRIAIDDFGSGYSNFERLAKLDIDYIKIDGSLISNIDTAPLSHIVVELVNEFAQKINVKTVAEFVSSSQIESIIQTIGINESQGYLFGAPIRYNTSMRHKHLLSD